MTNHVIEIWRDIPNYEGYYQVSNLGEVRSLPRYRRENGMSNKDISDKYRCSKNLIATRRCQLKKEGVI